MMWSTLAQMLLQARQLLWRIVYRGYRARYQVDPTFRFNGAGIQLYGEGDILLGSESYIGELSTLQAERGQQIQIGRRCRVSHNVRIYTSTADANCNFVDGPVSDISGSVAIEDGAWIGANCFIGPGLVIGRNAVVGANSVVTRSIPTDEIWGGVPARLIRRKPN